MSSAYPLVSMSPNMLWSALSDEVASVSNLLIGRRSAPGPEAQQGLKRLVAFCDGCGERRIHPDRRGAGPADPVVRARQPLLQVPDGATGQRYHGRGAPVQRRSERLDSRDVRHAHGTPPDTPGKPLQSRTGAETRAGSPERTDASPRYATSRAFFMTLWRPCSRNDGRSCGLRWG